MFKINYCDYNAVNTDYDLINRPNGSGDYLFLYLITPMKIYINGQMTITKANACFLYTPHFPQFYQAVKTFKNSYIHFSAPVAFIEQFKIPVNQVFYPKNYEHINTFIKAIQIEYLEKQPLFMEQIDTIMLQLFIDINRALYTTCASQTSEETLRIQFQKARLQILTNSTQDWTTETMAELTNLSKSQFYYYYKLFFNQSPKAELLDVRIEKAKNLLTNEALQIHQVSQLAGFHNVYHFTRYFKKICGCPPSKYAKTLRK